MGASQQFSLRWNNYLHHITTAFDSLRSDLDLVDVTLSCEGKKIKAHKMLLSACSTYFKDLFKENPCQHPVIIFRNVNFSDLEALIDFMYQGEVNVVQEQLASFLTTAELLAVQGLTDGTGRDLTEGLEEENQESTPVPTTEIPTEKKRPSSSNNSFYNSSTQNPVSPPTKRKKWSSPSVPPSSQKPRNESTESRRQAQTSSTSVSSDSVEIIPVMSHVKLELPEFLDNDSGQVGYNNTGQEENLSESEMSGLDHNIPTASTSSKEESLDIYGGNSSDVGDLSGEQMTPAELSQVLAKAGPSSEGSQDSLQGGGASKDCQWTGTQSSESPKFGFTCEICGKSFKHRNSRYNHMPTHFGTTKCPICHAVLGQRSNMKRHLKHVHRISVAPN